VVWIHHVVADLELDMGQRFCFDVAEVLFRLLCDGVLLSGRAG